MNDNVFISLLMGFILLLIIFTAGDPDLLDALINITYAFPETCVGIK